jgi:hypothetical protein
MIIRMVGCCSTRQLSWKRDIYLRFVRNMWLRLNLSLDGSNFRHRCHGPPLSERREKMSDEIWNAMGGVLQEGSMETDSRGFLIAGSFVTGGLICSII